MKITESKQPTKEAQQTLTALREIIAKELERKKRLGHYAVFWENGKIVLKGEDAPKY